MSTGSMPTGVQSTKAGWLSVNRLLFAAFVASVLFFAFLAGVALAMFKVPPYGLIYDAARAAKALLEEQGLLSTDYPPLLWSEVKREGSGVTVHDPERAWEGYTVYTSGDHTGATLIDMSGRIVHRWAKPFREAWPNPTHIRKMVPENHLNWRRAWVFPNGDVLAFYETTSVTPSGLGMVKLDRDSNLIWKYDGHVHHDQTVGPDGTIYCLTRNIRHEPHPAAVHLGAPVLEDYLVLLSPEGKQQKAISIFDAFADSPYRFVLDSMVPDPRGDSTHTNTVHLISAEFASHYDAIEPGQIMTCIRNINVIAVIDPQSESVVWAMRGIWEKPHDPDPLPNGRIMIFDNQMRLLARSGSRIMEFDPATQEVSWIFAGNSQRSFYSRIRSCQQPLPNGNVLITESDCGRLLEVTRGKEIVWEYVIPTRGGKGKNLVPIACGATRYSAEELPFLTELEAEGGK